MAKKPYFVLIARLALKQAELAKGLLYQVGLNTFSEKRLRSALELQIQLPPRASASSLIQRLRAEEKRGPGRKVFSTLRRAKIVRGAWAQDYQKFLKPFRLLEARPGGAGPLGVDPRGIRPQRASDDWLYIIASLAFGTGTHATTRLSAEFLARALAERPQASVLDMGCGTAILSMVARRCGAKQAQAIDNDPTALEMARENIRINQISHIQIKAELPKAGKRFDIIVANIERNTLLQLRPRLLSHLKPRGQLILSGLLYRDAAPVLQAYGGLQLRERRNKKGWTALWLTRDIL